MADSHVTVVATVTVEGRKKSRRTRGRMLSTTGVFDILSTRTRRPYNVVKRGRLRSNINSAAALQFGSACRFIPWYCSASAETDGR